MIKNWRLTSDIVLMIEKTEKEANVYIASPEKKQFEVAVRKLCKNIYTSETVENTDFDVKISKTGPEVYIKIPSLPTLGWVKVVNFYIPEIWNMLGQCNITHGEFTGKFKAAFSEADPKTVFLVSPEMAEYSEAQDEMKRRLRCEIGKKTKNLKPGHRYDLPKETRYYLCSVVSRKSNLMYSDFLGDTETSRTKAYIYTNILYPGDSSVSGVLNNRKFGTAPEDLKVAIQENTSWIDSGVKLTDDFSGNIKDYWKPIIKKTIDYEKHKIYDDSDYIVCTNFQDVLGILGCQSSGDLGYTGDKELKDMVEGLVRNTLEYNLLINWKLRKSHPELELSDKKEYDKNAEALERLFYGSLEDENIHKFSYYQTLFERLEIGLNKISEYLVATFSESDLTKSFEDYLNYKFFWKNKKTLYNSRNKPILDYILSPEEEPENLFGNSELSSVICELYDYADNNYGDGVSEYKVWDSEKKGSSGLNVLCRITLEDIMKYKKGVSGMSEGLKNEIIFNKFDNITISRKKE